MPDLPDELIRTNAILGEYVTIHDAIFKFSWRKALSSIPRLFKATDFGVHVRELDRLASNLAEISTALKASGLQRRARAISASIRCRSITPTSRATKIS
jgi:hypothetical protein